MKGDQLPDPDHVARYCGGSTVEGKEILPPAFYLGPNETYLSVNWLEYLNCTNRLDEIKEVRKVLASKLSLGSIARIAVLNVGQVISHVMNNSPDSRELAILHEPILREVTEESEQEPEDPSHSGIHNIKPEPEDVLIAELIAQIVLKSYSAK